MCTAATYQTRDFYFGRTLDYDFSYQEEVTVTPRRYPFRFCGGAPVRAHFAIIGMAYVLEDYPLYYDAVNEKGLGMAGLNFVGNAVYQREAPDRLNIAQYELIPWILTQCASVKEARALLEKTNLTGKPFHTDLPIAELHWIIADRHEALTLESVEGGLKLYPNPVGILTNNPPFKEQLFQLNNYMSLSPKEPQNRFLRKAAASGLQPRNGRAGPPGRFILPVAVRARFLCKIQFGFERFRKRKRRPVFSYFRSRGTAAGLLCDHRRKIRDYHLYLLLQRR